MPTRWPRSSASGEDLVARTADRGAPRCAAERDNRALNVWLTHPPRERALAEADAADARLAAARTDPAHALDQLRPLLGILDRAQGPRVGGRRAVHRRVAILEGFIPPYDGTCVEKLRAAGAVILGKVNCDEFAMGSSTENSAYQQTTNPWDKTAFPVARRAVARRPSRRACARQASAPTPVARFVSRPHSVASSGSSRRMGVSRAGASSPLRRRSISRPADAQRARCGARPRGNLRLRSERLDVARRAGAALCRRARR